MLYVTIKKTNNCVHNTCLCWLAMQYIIFHDFQLVHEFTERLMHHDESYEPTGRSGHTDQHLQVLCCFDCGSIARKYEVIHANIAVIPFRNYVGE